MDKIKSHKDLNVYQEGFKAAIRIHEISKSFPAEEKYSLTDQIRRSSRSVCANLAELWRKRRYPKNFVSKLTDVEAEASETQVWLDFAHSFNYISYEEHQLLYDRYEHIIAMLINRCSNPERWSFKQ
ncbi:four helix bundle protein [Mangrovibacterium lignilyticum]|uniref:four helix bundle protein n=1 Tax=Mangrovibacterium lignilyticum TaxID=2668052 RepID=UPI0013CF4748|nr:four helix bundle protein [Mangrovibacterium lignilyticum]